MNTSKVNRITVIDHSRKINDRDEKGRLFERWWDDGVKVELDLQDEGRTLKVFIGNK